jgi:hypothetical protein
LTEHTISQVTNNISGKLPFLFLAALLQVLLLHFLIRKTACRRLMIASSPRPVEKERNQKITFTPEPAEKNM